MTKFKVGDKVRRIAKHSHLGMHQGDEGVVSSVSGAGEDIAIEGYVSQYVRHPFTAKSFELVTPEKLLPLTFVLKMDREIAKAGGSPGLLEDYLDRPLNEFVQNVMIPNRLTLKFV